MSRLPVHLLITYNLRRLTEDSHLSLGTIADRAGIDRRELFDVLAGQQDADLSWLCRLAHALGVPMSQLVLDPPEEAGWVPP